MSAFDKWFIAQHGARSRMPKLSDQELQDRIEAGEMAKTEAARRALWDQLRNSALYAWQVNDSDKR